MELCYFKYTSTRSNAIRNHYAYIIQVIQKGSHNYWAEITAPLVSNGWCIVYVEFVRPPLLNTRLREEHGEKAGSFYRRGLSGYDKDEVLKSWRAGMIKVTVATKALGLEVNQFNVDVVVRIRVSPSVEELVQQLRK